ncbi:MAG TPA: hypothetical protein VK358_05635 [Longimicrobium sp.]|nr:hypothetical protein [Longimicrobium sp.]
MSRVKLAHMYTKSTTQAAGYPPPLDRLLGLGILFTRGREWRDYRQMGMGPDHVPELIRMACDPELNHAYEDDPRVYAPLHAWRALGQLAAPEAAGPVAELLARLPDDDSANDELPEVLGMIGGTAAVAAATGVLANSVLNVRTRISAATALLEIGERHPELRDRCVEMLMGQLKCHEGQPESLNGFLVDDLAELGAVEAAPLIQAAFAAGRVDILIRGDWEDVQVDLGLLPERVTPRPRLDVLGRLGIKLQPPERPGTSAAAAAAARRKEDKRRKAKRASRKRRK